MVFSEPVFIFLFLPAALLIYYSVPFAYKNTILFLSGLLFYSWGEPFYAFVAVLSALIDYSAGLVIDKFDEKPAVRKSALAISVVMNLLLLGIFKYSGFFIKNVDALFRLSIPDPGLPLPIGLSFFTFQSMSYTIDLYRREVKTQKNFIDFAAFVTMFPQIVAGPIVRYSDVADKLAFRKIDFSIVSDGISLFICGLCKKVLIADSLGELWTAVKAEDYASLPAVSAWLGIIAFALQIYFDFSGYSDMAAGLGKALGFDFPKNFDYPYVSASATEFWRRWHTTLGVWFKNYVYIPLGGNRGGTAKTVRNLLIVWLLTGFWHGADFNFIIWGLYYGVILILEKFVFAGVIKKLPRAATRIYTLFAVVIGWVIFEISSPAAELEFISAMFGASGTLFNSESLNFLCDYALTTAIACVIATGLPLKALRKKLSAGKLDALSLVGEAAGAVACVAYAVGASYTPFLYFNF